MKRAGVVIERWKLAIFKRHLDEAGFEYAERDGFTAETMVLVVMTPTVSVLQPVLEAAQKECKAS